MEIQTIINKNIEKTMLQRFVLPLRYGQPPLPQKSKLKVIKNEDNVMSPPLPPVLALTAILNSPLNIDFGEGKFFSEN